jgi:hypothetical protein
MPCPVVRDISTAISLVKLQGLADAALSLFNPTRDRLSSSGARSGDKDKDKDKDKGRDKSRDRAREGDRDRQIARGGGGDRAREGDRDKQSGHSGGGRRGDNERDALLKQKQAELASIKKEKAERFEAARGLIRNYQVRSVGIAIASVHPFSSLSPPSLYLAVRSMHAQTRLANHIFFLVRKRAPIQT